MSKNAIKALMQRDYIPYRDALLEKLEEAKENYLDLMRIEIAEAAFASGSRTYTRSRW